MKLNVFKKNREFVLFANGTKHLKHWHLVNHMKDETQCKKGMSWFEKNRQSHVVKVVYSYRSPDPMCTNCYTDLRREVQK